MLHPFLIAGLLQAQILVTLVPVSTSVTKAIFNGRIAKRATLWTVTLENQSPQAVSVEEPAVLRRVPQIRPLDHVLAVPFIAEGLQDGVLSRLARLAGDGSSAASFLGTGRILSLTTGMKVALAGASFAFPYVASRIAGIEHPVTANYAAMAWTGSVMLTPNGSASTHILSERWTGPVPISFVIDTDKAPAMRTLR